MESDQEFYKQLFELFKIELEEHLEKISQNLLALDQEDLDKKTTEEMVKSIFICTHNIKGSAPTVGVENVGLIAHHLEDIFSKIRDGDLDISSSIITVALSAVDKIRLAMKAYIDQSDLPFDLSDFLETMKFDTVSQDTKDKIEKQTEDDQDSTSKDIIKEDAEEKVKKQAQSEDQKEETRLQQAEILERNNEYIKISTDKVYDIASLSDELQSICFNIDSSAKSMLDVQLRLDEINKHWVKKNKEHSILCDLQKEYFLLSSYISEINRNLHLSNNQLNSVNSYFQRNIRNLRLVPASTVIRPLLRVARDIGDKLDKKIKLDIVGDDLEIDRIVLDLIKSPLVHLLRNAIDHGIEERTERVKQGKSGDGHIKIELSLQGARANICISDDGRGINPDDIVDKAVALGIIKKGDVAHLDENGKIDLIFSPGFSICDNVSDISGRGVGLDVVKENVNKAKGSVSINSTLYKGTQFNISLPVSLATERGVFFTVDQKYYVLPSNFVYRIVHLKPEDIKVLDIKQAIVLDNKTIPLHYMKNVLEQRKDFDDQNIEGDKLSIIVLFNNDALVAFIVDYVLSDKEIVIKPLPRPLNALPNISGATIAIHGEVIIVLDPINLINTTLGMRTVTDIVKDSVLEEESSKPRILVVDDSITTRTLEVNILLAHGFDVLSAVNGKEACDVIKQEKIDLVVADIEMPEMDGFELTEKIKQDNETKEIPVIIVSSRSSEQDKARGLSVGADAYIVKNQFESQILLDAIEQFL